MAVETRSCRWCGQLHLQIRDSSHPHASDLPGTYADREIFGCEPRRRNEGRGYAKGLIPAKNLRVINGLSCC